MNTERDCGSLIVKDGWLMCPACGAQKVLRVYPETLGKSVPVFCKLCKQETLVALDRKQLHFFGS